MTVQRNRCRWCAELQDENVPGAYKCGTVGENRGRKCYKDCGEKMPVSENIARVRRKHPSEWAKNGRRKTPERIEIEAMQIGDTRYFDLDREKLIRFCQCLVSQRNDGSLLKVRNDGERLIANLVSRIDDIEIGESRKYSDDFSLVRRLILNRNLKFLRGQEGRMLAYDLIDGVYWLKRIA